jgi:hypothetical protein
MHPGVAKGDHVTTGLPDSQRPVGAAPRLNPQSTAQKPWAAAGLTRRVEGADQELRQVPAPADLESGSHGHGHRAHAPIFTVQNRRYSQDGRRRRTFSITDAGRAALQDWLADPSAALPDIRDSGLLKLFFGAHASTEQLVALARNQRDAHQQRLDLYESLREVQGSGPAAATLGLGLAWERAATAFWTDIADQPPTHST